jgi:hypothetical protein
MDSTLEGGTQAAQSAASPVAVQPNSFDPAKFEANLLAKFQAMITDPRSIQSVKDKALAEIRKDKSLKDFLAEYQSLKASGMTDKEIEQEARLREIEARFSAPVPQSANGMVVVQPQVDPVSALLPVLGLEANDPEVTSLMAGNGQIEEKLSTLATLAARKRQTQPNPALVAQPAGGGTSQASQAQLEAQYKKEVLANRGNKTAIRDLQRKYQEQGLDVYAVNFSV